MARQSPESPFEELLGSLTDEELTRQELIYQHDLNKIGVMLEAVRAAKAARRMMSGNTGRTVHPPADPRQPTLYDAVLAVTGSEPDRVWTANEILSRLTAAGMGPNGQTPKNSVDATLSRLVSTGRVDRVARGRYRLISAEALIQEALLENGAD